MSESVPVVVIVGGGFGGLAAATALKGAPVRVILIDRANHHLFNGRLWVASSDGSGTTFSFALPVGPDAVA